MVQNATTDINTDEDSSSVLSFLDDVAGKKDSSGRQSRSTDSNDEWKEPASDREDPEPKGHDLPDEEDVASNESPAPSRYSVQEDAKPRGYKSAVKDRFEARGEPRRLICLGKRPKDYRVRDLLLASLLRDHRTPLFRKFSIKPLDWMQSVPDTVPAKFRRTAQQLLVLDSMQRSFIGKLRSDWADSLIADGTGQMLDAIADCMPQGGLFERRGPTDTARPCHYSRLCSWCHARKIERLYRFLVGGPCAPDRLAGKHLFTARMPIPGCSLGPRLHAPHTEDAKRARAYWGREFMRWIRSLRPRVKGGLMLFQVGSDLSQDVHRERGFLYEFFFVGTAALSSQRALDHFKLITGLSPDKRAPMVNLAGIHSTSMPCSLVPADQPHALRYLLFGTPYKYPVDRLGISLCKHINIKYGLQGAAALQPWYLFTSDQARVYHYTIKGVRLYDLFGDWRGYHRKRRPRVREFPAQSGRRGVSVRRRAFRLKNESRCRGALDRRQQLAFKAEPVFNQLREELGRPPGSPRLKAAMAQTGHPISDRDARWLVKDFAS